MSNDLMRVAIIKPTLLYVTMALGIAACTSEQSITEPSSEITTARTAKTYTAIDLGTLGGPISRATAINAAGQVVGSSELPNGEQRAFLWDKGIMINLGTLGGNSSQAMVISPAGEVYGLSTTAAGGPAHVFRWKRGRMTDLGFLGGVNVTEPHGINPRGQLVGQTLVPGPSGSLLPHAFVWEKGVMRDLGVGVANAINPRGEIVGRGPSVLARLWSKTGVRKDLPALGVDGADAAAINPRGQIVGVSTLLPSGEEPVFTFFHAVLWENGAIRDLGVLSCDGDVRECNSAATGINPSRQVVGWSDTKEGFQHAFIWENGVMTDLDPSRTSFSRALAINPRGQIAGISGSHATLWTRK